MFGKCRVCSEKDKTIKCLEAEVVFLRKLAMPDTNHKIPLVALESDAVLSGHDEQIHLEDELETADEELSERDRLLSGTYDQD